MGGEGVEWGRGARNRERYGRVDGTQHTLHPSARIKVDFCTCAVVNQGITAANIALKLKASNSGSQPFLHFIGTATCQDIPRPKSRSDVIKQ